MAVAEEKPSLHAISEEDLGEDRVPREEYAELYKRATRLYRQMCSLPDHVFDAVGMERLGLQLIEQFKNPESKDPITPLDMIGATVDPSQMATLEFWVDKSQTLLFYATYRMPKPKLRVINSVREVPGYRQNKYPWIDGWDNPSKRKKLVYGSNKNNRWPWYIRWGLIGGAGAGVYFGGRWLLRKADEKLERTVTQNPALQD